MTRQYGSSRHRRVLGALVLAVVTACSGTGTSESDGGEAPGGTTASDDVETTDATAADATATASSTPELDDGPLAEVCPATVAVQAASLPDPAVGPLYALLGPDPVVDATAQSASSPLVRVDGTVEDVVLEIRSGGPAVGFRNPVELLSDDGGLLLAQASTAVSVRAAAETPSIGVVTLTDRSHDALIVDPATYPGVETVDALRDADIEIRHVTDQPFISYLTAAGSLAPGQLVPGFDGEPAAFVQSGGTIAQQGDLLIEPMLLPSLPQWGRPVTAIAAASAGWVVHDDALVARPADIVDLRACFGRLVPVIQQAIAAYAEDPGPTNIVMADIRSRFAPLTRLTPELLDSGVAAGRDAGVFGSGTTTTVGDFDVERLRPFLPELAASLGVDTVEVEQLMTNEFIDSAITSAG